VSIFQLRFGFDEFRAIQRSGLEARVKAQPPGPVARYFGFRIGRDQTLYGAGMHGNIVTATLRAVLSAVNRAALKGLITVREPAQRVAAA